MSYKNRILKISTGAFFFMIGFFPSFDDKIISLFPNINPNLILLIIYLTAYLIVGGDVVLKAFRNILKGQIFDENFLMSLATIGAFIIGEYPEGVAVMLFYQIGELFQDYAINKSRKSIADLMDIRPDYANVVRNGETIKVDPDEVNIGEEIIVKPGEKIALDGKIIDGYSVIDTSALTGESLPREVSPGDDILSGCVNMSGLIRIKVSKEFGESTVSKILDLVENASSKKSESEKFITKFAKYYTPIVVIIAILLAIIPPLVLKDATFNDWIYRALVFLVISCPCALVISIPLGFFGGIGGASAHGVLVKGSNYLEALSKTEMIVFDKTGTLTKGVFKVTEIVTKNISKEKLLEIAAYAESYSTHPISISLQNAYGKNIDNSKISDVEEIPGHGVKAIVEDKVVLAGNNKLMKKMSIEYSTDEVIGTVVHIAMDGDYKGYIVISDEIKLDSKIAIKNLKNLGIKKTIMLTGDSKVVGEKVANELGLDLVYTELLPADKVQKVEELLKEKSKKGSLSFVGDGINDAPVLARADVGIAMGGLGSDAAIEAADIVIMDDEPSKIATTIKIAKKTLSIVKQNIFFALVVKFIVLILGAGGIATMWEAIFADVGVSVLAILNAMRAMNFKNKE
ncbi:MAG: cadmium-translocating P-type ATPase [Leptotrichiaceae bacterium]|nr:cadmium-translocating P-type ATPase [Leptotrichiaceae bacterium]MBP7101302.1 cadmium-translocating P-type ATPase [Leptotrichiaceae bacterium]MBP7725031.1 cadmium-translocating P-type ATPase [Leptotrichiaceae bacterium]